MIYVRLPIREIDSDDELLSGDWVNVQYRYQEQKGMATKVLRYVYPRVVFPAEKTKEIPEVTMKSDRK